MLLIHFAGKQVENDDHYYSSEEWAQHFVEVGDICIYMKEAKYPLAEKTAQHTYARCCKKTITSARHYKLGKIPCNNPYNDGYKQVGMKKSR